MYVPAHLGGVHKTLMQYGYNMRERYGNQFKRNIRFEDAEHSLCIDIKLPDNTKWITIDYAHALADRRAWSQDVLSKHLDVLSSRPSLAQGAISMDCEETAAPAAARNQVGMVASSATTSSSAYSSATKAAGPSPLAPSRLSSVVNNKSTAAPGTSGTESTWGPPGK